MNSDIKVILGSIVILSTIVIAFTAYPFTEASHVENPTFLTDISISISDKQSARLECGFDSSSPNKYQSKKNIEGPAEVKFILSDSLQTIRISELATKERMASIKKECIQVIVDANQQAVSQCIQNRIDRLKNYSIISKDICALVFEESKN